MDFAVFPKVLPKSPKQERGQIQVRTLTSKGKKSFLKNVKYRNKHLLSQAVIFCLGGYYASNSTTRFSTGHFWSNVFRQKVSYLSTTMKTAWICACEMMLFKCLFSAVYSLNTLSFVVVKFCSFYYPAKSSPLFLPLQCVYTVCCNVTYLCFIFS